MGISGLQKRFWWHEIVILGLTMKLVVLAESAADHTQEVHCIIGCTYMEVTYLRPSGILRVVKLTPTVANHSSTGLISFGDRYSVIVRVLSTDWHIIQFINNKYYTQLATFCF